MPTARPRPRWGNQTQWVNPFSVYDRCEVTEAEMKAATRTAIRDITRGKTPVPKGKTPHVIMTVGAPGSGKSTVASAATGGDPNYVVVDFDVAIKYHPRYLNLWVPTEASGRKPERVKFTMMHGICNDAVEDVMTRVAERVSFDSLRKYNVILQSHNPNLIIKYKQAGYKVSVLFVGVPLKVALARSRRRAIDTGQFLSPTLEAQDDLVTEMWHHYVDNTPWFGMWADELLVVDNGRASKAPQKETAAIAKRIRRVNLHGADWAARIRRAEDAIRDATR